MSARLTAVMLRHVHAGAMLSLAAALFFSVDLLEREGVYQPMSLLADTAHWASVLCGVGIFLAISNLTSIRLFRSVMDAVAALVWITIAILIGGVTGINMGSGMYGFMFLLSVACFAAEMSDWLDQSSPGTRFMERVKTAGDRRSEKDE